MGKRFAGGPSQPKVGGIQGVTFFGASLKIGAPKASQSFLEELSLEAQTKQFAVLHCFPSSSPPTLSSIMASSLRIGSSMLKSYSILSKPIVQRTAFNGIRCASTKVGFPRSPDHQDFR